MKIASAQLSSTHGLRAHASEYQPRINPGVDGILPYIGYTSLQKMRTAQKHAVPSGEHTEK